MTIELNSNFGQEQRVFFIHPRHFEWTRQALSAGIKRPVRDSTHSPPSSADFVNGWSCTSTPLRASMPWKTLPFHLPFSNKDEDLLTHFQFPSGIQPSVSCSKCSFTNTLKICKSNPSSAAPRMRHALVNVVHLDLVWVSAYILNLFRSAGIPTGFLSLFLLSECSP